LDIYFYTGTNDSTNGTFITGYSISGLPGSTAGELACLISGDIDLAGGLEFVLPSGDFGYSYVVPDDNTGPIIAVGGTGITDMFRMPPDPANYSFGGDPFAQFWMRLYTGTTSPPPNDDCATPAVISSLPFNDSIDTTLATTAGSDPLQSCTFGGAAQNSNSVWYQYTPASNTVIDISTCGSDYDTVLSVYTGSCGSLTEVGCNDDSCSLKSEISGLSLTGGTTYYIEVTDWFSTPGGGTLDLSVTSQSLYQGPASDSIPGGASVSTDGPFAPLERTVDLPFEIPIGRIELAEDPGIVKPLALAGTNVVEDVIEVLPETNAPPPTDSFQGIPDAGSFIPPDPHMAAGPNHLMLATNTDFAIFDKSGNNLFQLDATVWFSNVLAGLGGSFSVAMDPQLVYDHHADRWVMIYIASNFSSQSYLLVSTSDDSDPMGTWCNFAIPGHQNGPNVTTNLNDYPKLGVDSNAIYVTANMFAQPSFSWQYVQLRIMEKTQFYNNTCGSISWTDFWDLRDPDNLSQTVFTTVPAVTFGTPGVEYLIGNSPYEPGNFMTLWTVNDPVGTPTLSATNVPVTSSNSPPDADQLGGGTPRIDVGGGRVRNAVYRAGSVWTSHSVECNIGGGDTEACARYVRIDVSGPTTLEDIAFGAQVCWYYYPAVTPDAGNNLVEVFTRSCTAEYAGVRYTGRLNSDPPGLQPSELLKAGEDNYVKTFGGSRNRWGDYSGIALDPVHGGKVWMFGEYAATSVGSGVNDDRWGTWVSGVAVSGDIDICSMSFNDVSGHWAYNYIEAIFCAGITIGYPDGTYRPLTTVNRAQMAAFIIRAVEGEPSSNYCGTTNPFPDVSFSHWACKYIKRLSELGITTGYPDGTYRPTVTVNRAQMATFIIRAVEGEPSSNYCGTTNPFPDVSFSHWACKYIKRLSELGITTGYPDGTYRPLTTVNRAQMAAFIARAFLGMT
jgi:hypothetical protein